MNTLHALLLGSALMVVPAASAVEYIGPPGGSWFDPAHWSGGVVPTDLMDVDIPVDVVIDLMPVSATARSVTVQQGATLAIPEDMALIVREDVTIDHGAVLSGAGLVRGDVVNHGLVDPAPDIATLEIDGDFTQGMLGVLRIDVSQEQAHDQLIVSHTADLHGGVRMIVNEPYAPALGDMFSEVLTWVNAAGEIDYVHLIGADECLAGAMIDESYSYGLACVERSLEPVAHKVTPPVHTQHASFGHAVSMEADIGLIGGPGVMNEDGVIAGAVYVYDVQLGAIQRMLVAPDPQPGARFGWAVNVDGDSALIGADRDGEVAYRCGAAYLFDATTGSMLRKLTPVDGAAQDGFGTAVALRGDIAVIGAPGSDIAGEDAGAVYVHQASTGAVLRVLVPDDAQPGDGFGSCVAMHGDFALISLSNGDGYGDRRRVVYVFDVLSGQQEMLLSTDDPGASDHFGCSVALHGSLALIGDAYDRSGGDYTGAAHAYDIATGIHLSKYTSRDLDGSDSFGSAVSADGSLIVIGAPGDDDAANNGGAAYVFDMLTGEPLRKISALDPESGGKFGESVAVGGDGCVLVGAPEHDIRAYFPGAAYAFEIATGADCNDNGVPDQCDIEHGSDDANANGVPDECEVEGVYIGPWGGGWLAPEHWGGGQLPTAESDVLVSKRIVIEGGDAYAHEVTIANDGELFLADGTLTVDTLRITSGGRVALVSEYARLTAHTIEILDGGELAWDGGEVVITDGGSMHSFAALSIGALSPACLTLNNAALEAPTITVNSSGVLEGTGVITTADMVRVHGALRPGLGVGSLTIDGNCRIEYSGVVEFELAGADPEPDHDVLVVTGEVRVTGAMTFMVLPPYAPMDGDAFAGLITFGTCVWGNVYVRTAGGDPCLAANPIVQDQTIDMVFGPVPVEWESGKLHAENPREYEHFGTSLAAHGDRIAICASQDHHSNPGVGSVTVYDADTLEPLVEIHAEGVTDDANFGFAIDLDGDYLIVGAPGDSAPHEGSGSARIYDLATGDLLHVLTASDAEAGAEYGSSVSILGAYALVGAPYQDDAGDQRGAAYLYDVATGQELVKLTPTIPVDHAKFGFSVSLGPGVAVVGAPYDDSDPAGRGAVYVFETPSGEVIRKVSPDDPAAQREFGYAVAMNNSDILVGDPSWSESPGYEYGAAYVFDAATGEQSARLTVHNPIAHEQLGRSLVVNGEYACIGAPLAEDPDRQAGRAFLFHIPTGQYVQRLKPSDSCEYQRFGQSLAMTGSRILIGDPRAHAGARYSGAVYIHDYDPAASIDCNLNGVLDHCDIALGGSPDANGDGVPDECASAGFYIGPHGGDWFDPGNWVGGAVPDASTDVTITRQVVIPAGDAQAGHVLISGEGRLMIGGGVLSAHALTVRQGGVLTIDHVNARVNVTTLAIEGDGVLDWIAGVIHIRHGGVFSCEMDLRIGCAADALLSIDHAEVVAPAVEVCSLGVVRGSGVFRVISSVVNHGSIDPGAEIGSISIEGDYEQTEEGELAIDLAGLDPASEYDSIAIAGDAVLGGILSVRILSPYQPNLDDQFINVISFNAGVVNFNEAHDDVADECLYAAMIISPDRLDLEIRPTLAAFEPTCTLAANDGDDRDEYGASASISDQYILIGAPRYDSDHYDTGAAYLYDAESGALLHTFIPTDSWSDDQFGGSVCVNGHYALIGAKGNDSEKGGDRGAAYLYDTTTGELIRKLTPPAESGSTLWFGAAVSIYDDHALIGCPADSNVMSGDGSAMVVDLTTGNVVITLYASDPAHYDYMGSAVALTDEYAIVGAPEDDTQFGSGSGSVRVFDVETGDEVHVLTPDAGFSNGKFGCSVAVSNDLLVVGSWGARDTAYDAGAAYVFDLTTGAILHTLLASDGQAHDTFGWSVSIDHGLIIVGAPYADCGESATGAAYVFDAYTGQELFKLTTPTPDRADFLGRAVALHQGSAIVGADQRDSTWTGPGYAHLFTGLDADCDRNGVFDACDLSLGFSFDCNGNGAPDECDIAEGTSEDLDGDGVPDECQVDLCPWDTATSANLEKDGVVNLADLNMLLSHWGDCEDPCPWDFAPPEGDGIVSLGDLNALLSNWGPCPE
jgi:WD40 repeat protein